MPQAGEWWNQFIEPEHFEDLRVSSKLVLLFAILKEAEQIGDKVYVELYTKGTCPSYLVVHHIFMVFPCFAFAASFSPSRCTHFP